MSSNGAFENCRERAVLFLGLDRNKSSGRVRQKLKQENYDPDLVETVIDYLKEIDYINDERAARSICRRYSGKRIRSRKAMLYVLSDAGIEQGVGKNITDTLPEDEESSLQLLAAYYRNSQPEYAKALRLLARRGYSAYISNKAINEFLSAKEEII